MSVREYRVYGPPGTGKTSFLGRQVERAVGTHGRQAIRVASLTRAAAAEIGGRVDLPRETVGTLHAHAYRALERPELAETPEGLKDWNEFVAGEPRLVMSDRPPSTLDDPGDQLPAETSGDVLRQRYSVLRARCAPPEAWPATVREFAQQWDGWKSAGGRLDFADLIDRAHVEFPSMPGGPSVFLLDEAQDISRHEMRLARQWGESCDTFVVVGDPDQNLYQWRGTDPAAFADTQVGEDRTRVLERSWRVPPAVHAYAQAWLEQQLPSRSGAAYLPRENATGLVRRPWTTDPQGATWTSPEPLVRELVDQAERGRTTMVLASCSYMLDPLCALLRRHGVPFHNPYRAAHGGWNPMRGAGRVRAYLRPSREAYGERARMWSWDDVRRWLEPLKAQGLLARGAKTFVDAKCTPLELIPTDTKPGDETCHLETLASLFLEDPDRHAIVDMDLDWYERNLLESRSQGIAYALNVAREQGQRALVDDPRIVVGTIHSVKGGEADAVYVFPDLSRSGFEGWLMRDWRHDAVARQFYVAFTRARDELVLCEPAGSYAVRFPPPAEKED